MDTPAPPPAVSTRVPISRILLWIAAGAFVLVILTWIVVNFRDNPSQFYRLFLIGLTNGAIYGLVALGYSLVYGILELINFAHGDVFMLGGMLVATLVPAFGLDTMGHGVGFWLLVLAILVLTMVFCGTINVGVELVAYRRLRNAPRLAPLITAIGMSFVLSNV